MFTPNPALLKRILGLKAPVTWQSAIALTEDLSATGFGVAKSEMGEGAEKAMAVTQTLVRQGVEVAIAYFARDEADQMATSALTWIAATPAEPEQFVAHVAAVRGLLESPSVLGKSSISLDQVQAWLEVGTPDNEVILSVGWPQDPVEGSPDTPAADVQTYRAQLRSYAGRVVTAALTASRDDKGQWNLQVLLIA